MQLVRCALLTFVLGILLITANCGDEVVVPTSGAAGMVISAKGKVTATREGEAARSLKPDDTVYVDDTLTTAAGASVTVSLTHNGVQWTLGESQTKRIQESIAWRATKQNASVFAKGEALRTSAAAADSIKMAADTASTARPEVLQSADSDVHAPEPAVSTDEPSTRGETTPGARQKPGAPTVPIAPPKLHATRSIKAPAAVAPKAEPPPPPPSPASPPPPPPPQNVVTDTDRVISPVPSLRKNSEPKKKAKKKSSPTIGSSTASATSALIASVAKKCKDAASGKKGTLSYKLVVTDGKFIKFETRSTPAGLRPLAACMKKKLKASDLSQIGNATGKLNFE